MSPRPAAIAADEFRRRVELLQRRMATERVGALLLPAGASDRQKVRKGGPGTER